MDKKITGDEVKAAAQSALAAKNKATDAKTKADEAGGVDPELNKAATDAAGEATEAESTAADLSQKYTAQQRDIGKMKAKKADIDKTLKEYGELDDDDEEDDDDGEIDPDEPLTPRKLAAIEAKKAQKTAEQLVAAVEDATERAAIKEALQKSINPALIASNPQQAFEQARAIANGSRNAKIIEEHGRKGRTHVRTTGAGAPPIVEADFEPTAEEARYMKPPFSMTKEEIVATRR